MQYSFLPLLVIGIAFIAIGISGQRAFLGIGLAFLVLCFIMAIRSKRS